MRNQKMFGSFSKRELGFLILPLVGLLILLIWGTRTWVNPAPPERLVISTGDGEGEYDQYAKLYEETFKEEGIRLEIRKSSGAVENYKRLKDPKSDVDVGFVHDGLGNPEEAPDLSSLGSLYYEPIWIFYRKGLESGGHPLTRFTHLLGKKIAVGIEGGGTHLLSVKILSFAGVNEKNANFFTLGWAEGADALKTGKVDAAIFLATPEDPVIKDLISNPSVHLMSLDQAEAITRRVPSLHHLVLPHGALNLEKNFPPQDVELVSATATLLARDSMHPALINLLLKAATQVHGDAGIFEKKNEFPDDKVDQFPLSDVARSYYKSGTPFWQKHLPFWLAAWIERFILVMIPLLALALPVIRTIPKVFQWRIRRKIHQRYGELKFLETQIENDREHTQKDAHFHELDKIEERVKQMRVPLQFSEHLYSLRGHIDFVREKIRMESGDGKV